MNFEKFGNKRTLAVLALSACVLGVGTGVLFWRGSSKQVQASTETIPVSTPQVQSIAKPSYVHYVKLADANVANPSQISAQIERLHHDGSKAGVLTTQFKQATHAKMTYRFGRKQPLNFTPAPLRTLVPAGFVLTGREYEGEMVANAYSAMYRLYENPNTKGRIEIIESKLSADKPLVLIDELMNEQVLGVPMTFERFLDKKGVVYYSVEMALTDKHYVINTKAVDKAVLMEFLAALVRSQMSN